MALAGNLEKMNEVWQEIPEDKKLSPKKSIWGHLAEELLTLKREKIIKQYIPREQDQFSEGKTNIGANQKCPINATYSGNH